MKTYKATIRPVKGKLYVCMTVPSELRGILGGQIRKSTGTTDRAEAERRLPEIGMQLNQTIQRAKSDLDNHALRDEIKAIAFSLNRAKEFDIDNANQDQLVEILRQLLLSEKYDVTHIGKFNVTHLSRGRGDSYSTPKKIDAQTRATSVNKVKHLLFNLDGSLHGFKAIADDWGEQKDWPRVKGKKAFQTHINSFVGLYGDLDISSIKPVTLYDFAQHLSDEVGAAQATIQNYIASISNVLNYAVRRDLIASNPAKGLDLRSYGKKAQRRKPFPMVLLHSLFSQKLPEDIRMLWSILISTGMRLDEAALLTKAELKEELGIQYFDLREALVKNDGSARKVPIPNIINQQLEEYISGRVSERLFDFPMNADGKAQNSASKKSMRFIRRVTSDPNLVTHSLRHNFKDMCRDAGIPEDLHNFITGHSGGDNASNYGEGHSLLARQEALNKITHPYLR